MCIYKQNKLCLQARFTGSLPLIMERPLTLEKNMACLTYEFWHEAFCHSAPSTLSKTKVLVQQRNKLPECPSNFYCETCARSKSTHSTPKPTVSIARTKGEYIHTDLCGPFPIPSLGNPLYYISFVDDATRYCSVIFLKLKSEAAEAVIHYITKLETQFGCKTKFIRTDNGGEYVNQKLTKFLNEKGINHHVTPPYSPESNGVAERLNHSIGEGIRSMLLPLSEKRLWAEAIETFVYIKNRQYHTKVENKTPYEALHGEKPVIDHLQPFGTKCFVHIPKAKRTAGSKLNPRAELGMFVGYTETMHQYRIFIPENGKVTVTADVSFPPYSSSQDKTPVNLDAAHQSNSPDPINQTTTLTWTNHPTTNQNQAYRQN